MFHFWGSDFLGLVAYFDVVLDVDPDPEAPIPNKELYDRCRKTCIRDHNFLASHKTFHGSDLPPIVSPIVDVSQPQIVTTPHPRIVPFVPIRGSPDPFYNRTATGHAPPPEINGYHPMFATFGEWAQNEADTENHIRLEEFPFHYRPQQKTLIIHFFEWHYDAEVEEERAEFLRLNGHNRPKARHKFFSELAYPQFFPTANDLQICRQTDIREHLELLPSHWAHPSRRKKIPRRKVRQSDIRIFGIVTIILS